jgi:copper chaperone CopZ
VKAVEVDFYSQLATVIYDAEKVQVLQLVEAINAVGFRASVP